MHPQDHSKISTKTAVYQGGETCIVPPMPLLSFTFIKQTRSSHERLLAVLPWLSVSEIALLHNNFSKDAVANVDRDCEHSNTNLKEVSRSTHSHHSTISARLALFAVIRFPRCGRIVVQPWLRRQVFFFGWSQRPWLHFSILEIFGMGVHSFRNLEPS